MTYVIAEPCVGNKDASCVEVCPVECIHPLPEDPDFSEVAQLYIDAAACIGCNACALACPVDAAVPVSALPPEWAGAVRDNAAYFAA